MRPLPLRRGEREAVQDGGADRRRGRLALEGDKPSGWSDRGAAGGLERVTGPERGQEGWREMESFGAGVGDPI